MGIFQIWQDIAHQKEMRESKDEILFGEVIKYMITHYGPLVELETTYGDKKIARFRLLNHPLLHSITTELSRHTGTGLVTDMTIGSIASLKMVAEVKNYVADPDDVLNMWKTDFANVTKITLLGDIKLNHQMNSVLAEKIHHFRIGDVVNNTLEEREKITQQLEEMISLLVEQLRKYKKSK